MKEINENIEKELDKQFPKGDSARGKALVLVAISQIELNKLKERRFKMIKDKKDILDKLKEVLKGRSNIIHKSEIQSIIEEFEE